MVDSANGISAELPLSAITFVPVELTVSVLRHPRTEWVGMSARSTIEGDGIGHTHADLFDQAGYLGTALQTLFVSPTSRSIPARYPPSICGFTSSRARYRAAKPAPMAKSQPSSGLRGLRIRSRKRFPATLS